MHTEAAEDAEYAEHAEAAEAAEHAVDRGQLQQAASGQLQTASGQPQAAMQCDLTDADAAKFFSPRGNPQIEPQNAGPEAYIQNVLSTSATTIRRIFEGMSDDEILRYASQRGLPPGLLVNLVSQASSSAARPNEGQLQVACKDEIAAACPNEGQLQAAGNGAPHVYASSASAIVEPAANLGGIRVP